MKLSVFGSNLMPLAVVLAEIGNEVLLWDPHGALDRGSKPPGGVMDDPVIRRAYWKHLSSLRLRSCAKIHDALRFGQVHIVFSCGCDSPYPFGSAAGHQGFSTEIASAHSGGRSIVLLGLDQRPPDEASNAVREELNTHSPGAGAFVGAERIGCADIDGLENFLLGYSNKASTDGEGRGLRSLLERFRLADWMRCTCVPDDGFSSAPQLAGVA